MAQNFEWDDQTRAERLSGTLHAPGATVGDVLTVNADKSVSPAPGGGSQPVMVASVVFTNAQIKGLPSLPGGAHELVAAPGANKMLWPLNAMIYCDTTAGAYSNVTAGGELGIGVALAGDFLTFAKGGDGSFGNGDLYNILEYGGISVAPFGPNSSLTATDPPQVYPWIYAGSVWENLPLSLYSINPDGDYTGGNVANKMVVAVTYAVIDTI